MTKESRSGPRSRSPKCGWFDAINDAKLLLERMPENVDRHLFLANLYAMDKRPRQAIDVYSGLLNDDPKNPLVLRSRADMLLSVGDHAAAVEDYETVVQSLGRSKKSRPPTGRSKKPPGPTTICPGFWPRRRLIRFATAGERLEYAEKAWRLTDHQAPHILSTLAAADAETGDSNRPSSE